jgi:hypothetical protein
MVKTVQQLRSDAIGDLKDKFASVFPEFKKEHDKLIEKPRCGICIRGYLNKIKDDNNLDLKLKEIYGEDVSVDFSKLNIISEMVSKTEDIELKDWNQWFDDKHKDARQAPNIVSTLYNEGVVTVTYLMQQERTLG